MARTQGPTAGFDAAPAPETHHIDVADEAGVDQLAQSIARLAAPGDVILLIGDLGAGKTTFARYFIRAHGIEDDIPSPTFSLAQIYDVEDEGDRESRAIWHFDLYRLEGERDLPELGIEEAFAEGITLIEWPDRLGSLVPADRLEIAFAFGPTETSRAISLRGFGRWTERVKKLAENRA